MVTLTHVDEDGLIIGGVTLMITEGDPGEAERIVQERAS